MKRRSIFAYIFGVLGLPALAQQWKECVPDNHLLPDATSTSTLFQPGYGIVCTEKNKPALNNQCPVCGTMADPYVRQYWTNVIENCHPDYDNHYIVSCDPPPTKHPYEDTSNLVRCKRCNAAFFQDA